MPEVSFFFDYRSPYAYLAHTRLRRMGAKMSYYPFDVRELMKMVGNVPTSVVCKAKNQYIQLDLHRWATHCDIPLNKHPDFLSIDFRRLLRATLCAKKANSPEKLVAGVFNAIWAEPEPLHTRSDLVAVLLRADAGDLALETLMDEPSCDDELDKATSAAAELGVFGAPSMFVGNEMFFGNDRIDFVQGALESGT